PIRTGQLAVLGTGDAIRVAADQVQDSRSPALDVYIMGGLPIGEPVAWYGPFVMNTHEELARAFDDYRSGRLGTIPEWGPDPRIGIEIHKPIDTQPARCLTANTKANVCAASCHRGTGSWTP